MDDEDAAELEHVSLFCVSGSMLGFMLLLLASEFEFMLIRLVLRSSLNLPDLEASINLCDLISSVSRCPLYNEHDEEEDEDEDESLS